MSFVLSAGFWTPHIQLILNNALGTIASRKIYNVDEDDLDVNLINDRGDYRMVLFTDASSQIQNNGPLFRYGLGIFLGSSNPENQALAAPLTCNSMMEVSLFQHAYKNFQQPSLPRPKYLQFWKVSKLSPSSSL